MKRRSGRAGTIAQRAALRARGAGHSAPPSTPGSVPFVHSAFALALILVGVVLLHRDALRVSFFADDYLFLEQVRGRSLFGAVTSPDGLGNFFRPVGRQLYFWLLSHFSGESSFAFHAANLVIFLGVVALLFIVAHRLAGPRAAAVAAGFLALHYSVDVPLRWVSGSQDLLAVLGALGALALYLSNFRMWAALPLLVGLLSKETVLLTPVIAVVAGRRPGEPWRAALVRAWPLGLAVVVWAALWLVTAPQRRGLGSSLGLEPLGAVAVFLHLIHVSFGIEWRALHEAFGRVALPWLPLLPVGLAVLGARAAGPAARDAASPFAAGIFWALAATVPLIAVAAVWSAYYYLFALCGVGLALGALAARGPRWMALAIVVALAAGSQSGRDNPEFASGRGAWNWQSRTNRRYIDRATDRVARYLGDMKRQRPTVEPRTTFFFAGLPAFLGWQTADGPLVRWAYRDTSLRSFYQGDFTLERAHRGPVLFFSVQRDTLEEEVRNAEELRTIALRTMLGDKLDTAHDLLTWLIESEPSAPDVLYLLGWLDWARGDTLAAKEGLERAGVVVERGPAPDMDRVTALIAAGDSAAAITVLDRAIIRAGLDARAHALMADLLMRKYPDFPHARVEALAVRALLPQDASAWARWGLMQANNRRHQEAIRSLERALALGIPNPAVAAQVGEILKQLQRLVPGGELAQVELRKAARARTP
jgi:tetratricopeptide (TPR) repeat protein